jgi:hypothetical protein
MSLRPRLPFSLPRILGRKPLAREIVLTLALKLLLLYGLWAAFFSQPLLPKMTEGMDPGRVAAVLVAAPPTPASR